VKKFLLYFLLLCPFAINLCAEEPEPMASGPADENLDDVLSRVRAAIGYEKIAATGKHVTIRSRTRDSGGHESVVETTFASDGRFLLKTSGTVDRICGFDGNTPWLDSWGTVRKLALAGRETNLVGTWIRTNYWLHPEAPLDLTLEKSADPAEPLQVGMKLEKGLVPWKIRIDRSTWLPVSVSRNLVGRETVIRLEEYADHDGWKVPHRITVHAYGKIVRESATESVSEARSFTDSGYEPRLGPPKDTRFDSSIPAALEVKRSHSGDRLLVHPLINGKDVGWFLFDTGAAGWTIATAAAEAAGLDVIGESPTTGTAGVKIAMKTCRANTIQLGPATFDNQIMRAIASAGLGGDCIGLVGYSLFARCVVEYDDLAATLSIHDPKEYASSGIFWQELVPGQIVPTISARFEGHEELFRIDTGANSALVFNTPCVRRLGLLEGRETWAIEAGGIDGEFSIQRGEIEWIEFGGRRFSSVTAEFSTREAGVLADPFTAGIICNDLLREFKLVLDYPRGRIGFGRRDGASKK